MKKVLYVISEFFAPYQNVGSVKFSKIVKYLSQNENLEIFIFTRKNFDRKDALLENDLEEMEKNGARVFYIDAGKNFYMTPGLWEKICRIPHYIVRRYISKKVVDRKYYKDNMAEAQKFSANALKLIQRQKLPKPEYIISTYDDWGGHILGFQLKQQYKDKVYWITDFRDPVGSFIEKGKYRKLCDAYTRRITQASDYTTFISDSLKHDIDMASDTKYTVAPIGFDYADYERVVADKGKLVLTYTGSFYGENRTLLPCIQALADLCKDGRIEKENIIFEYAGGYGRNIYQELAQYGFEKNYNDWGQLTRYQSMIVQDRADILLTAVWNTEEFKGMLGGKTLGYLPFNKPIIAIVGGNLAGSDMKRLITDCNAGVCYEAANHKEDYGVLKASLLKYYNMKMEDAKITHYNNKEAMEKYNLERVAGIYSELMEKRR